ncbi:MAG: hypothetical protein M3323_07085 [Actinomycetota bacterium]|nr:hypothetical protein [Actinomycetota bacterium]
MNGFDVTVNPNGTADPMSVVGFGVEVAFSGLNYVWCINGDVDGPVICLAQNVQVLEDGQPNYVTQNPDGSITVNGNELVADVELCV